MPGIYVNINEFIALICNFEAVVVFQILPLQLGGSVSFPTFKNQAGANVFQGPSYVIRLV